MGAVILTFSAGIWLDSGLDLITKPFDQFNGWATAQPPKQVAISRARLLHLICTSRVHPGRGKGISHLAVEFDPNITLFCPTQRPTGAKEEVSHVSTRTTRAPQP
jgi:hypothetical protein